MKTPHPLVFAKGFYFFFYAAWACLQPFLPLYYKSQGFNGAEIGLLASILPLMTLLAAPIWGGLADASHRHKQVLLTALLGAALAVLGLSQVRGFWPILLLASIYAAFSSTIIPLQDNAVITLLGTQRDKYGAQRLWGAIGWGLAGPVIGWLIGQYGLGVSFGGYIGLLLMAVLVASRMPFHITAAQTAYWHGIRRLLADRRWYLFLLIALLSGAGLSVISNFLFLYMDGLHASRTLMGLALTTATISEVIVLWFSGRMLRRWGPVGLLIVSLAAYVVRAYAYSTATAPWQVLIIQLMHGLTFSTMLVAGVSFASRIAPPGLGATAQSLFSSTVMGIGGITGAVIGGMLLDRVGGQRMYFWTATVVLIGLLILLAIRHRLALEPTTLSE